MRISVIILSALIFVSSGCFGKKQYSLDEVLKIAEKEFVNWAEDNELDLSFEYDLKCRKTDEPSIWHCQVIPPADFAIGRHWIVLVNEFDGSARVVHGI